MAARSDDPHQPVWAQMLTASAFSSDCGFGRQGCNIVREELGIEMRPVPAAHPELQTDIVPETPDR